MKEAIVDKCLAGRKLGKLLGLWARGLEFDWNVLYGPARPRRMNLPTYPFARERYWIAAAGAVRAVRSDGMASLLHPLLHTNTSDFRQQSYSSTFSGDEFFLSDHQVRTGGRSVQKVLPGVAYLEMARAAVTHASPAPPESSILELHNTVWLQPVYVGRQQELSIALFAHEGHERPDARIHYSFYSQGEEQEVVHCQGQAMFSHHPAPAQLDIARSETGDGAWSFRCVQALSDVQQHGPVLRGCAPGHHVHPARRESVAGAIEPADGTRGSTS